MTRRDDVRDVLSRPAAFSSTVAERLPDGRIVAATLGFARSAVLRPIQQSDPPAHTLKRRLAFEAFKPARLERYRPMIERVIDELIDDFQGDGEVEFVESFATPLTSRVIHNILGLPEEDARLAAEWGAFEGQATRYHEPERQAVIALLLIVDGGAGMIDQRDIEALGRVVVPALRAVPDEIEGIVEDAWTWLTERAELHDAPA